MKLISATLFLAGSIPMSACQAVDPPLPVAARLVSPTAEARQQLREVTAKFLGLGAVVLAEDTLTKNSQFMFSRTPRYDASGQLLQGRVKEQGQLFKLVLREDGCWLMYENKQNKNQQAKLSLAKCVAE